MLDEGSHHSLQSQSEQSGSELDSAVESPVLDTGDSDSQPVDVESVTPVVSQPHQQTNSFSAIETHVVAQSPGKKSLTESTD